MPKSHLTQAFVAFGLWSVTTHADAQSILAAPAAPAAEAAPAPGQPKNRARIVLVGALAYDRDLAALLHELLSVQNIEPEIVGAGRFELDSLFADGASDGATLVFVRLRDARDARLHFRAPSGERFLLRKVELPSGVDAVGRELLGQVIKSSVGVLLHSSKGLSRAEASAALARDAAPLERPVLEQPAPQRDATARTPGVERALARSQPAPRNEELAAPPPAPVRGRPFRAGLSYSLEWAGSDLPAAHGPGAALATRFGSMPTWGVGLAVQRLFPQRLRTPLVRAEVQRTDTQILLELELPLARAQSVLLALGPSLEVSYLEPTSGAAGVAIAAAKSDLAPAFCGEARYELGFGHLVLGAAAFVNVSLADTHYDVVDEGVRVRVATLGAVRPGGALTLSLE